MTFDPFASVYHVVRPTAGTEACPLVLDSPHSGTDLPADFHFTCDVNALQASVDHQVDALITQAPHCGATILTAKVARTYIDLNRALDDLDPAVCATPLPWDLHPTKRAQFGLGLIHTIARGQPIYDTPLTADILTNRVTGYYQPYHQQLRDLLQDHHDRFGHVLHLNIHAMPSRNSDGKIMPDIVIGDLDGASAHRAWRETVRDLFKAAGLVVTVNTPYKGVEIIKRTGKPRQGFQALQIEINKALYLDESTLQPHPGLADCIAVMQSIWQTLGGILLDLCHRDAAE